MPTVPDHLPEVCPVCESAFESVSAHSEGITVGLNDNERYQRVCFQPVENEGPGLYFFHHAHEAED